MITLTTPQGTVTAEADVQLANKWGELLHGDQWDTLLVFEEHTTMYALLEDIHEIRDGNIPGYSITETADL